jgi:hypothetical protein
VFWCLKFVREKLQGSMASSLMFGESCVYVCVCVCVCVCEREREKCSPSTARAHTHTHTAAPFVSRFATVRSVFGIILHADRGS